MVFSDSSTNLGLVQDVLFRTNTDVNQFPLKDITRYINEAYSRVASIIIKSDGRMQWDDTNHTDQPIATFDLVSGQDSYEIFVAAPTALQDWLMIDKVQVKDSASGNWIQLTQIDKRTVNEPLDELFETDGIPQYYDFNGSELYLYPATNYASSAGARIYFNRAPSYFASTDTTKVPGFATIFHPYLSQYAALQWNSIKKNDLSLQPLIDRLEKDIAQFYMKRNKSEVPTLARAYRTYE